MEMYAGDDACLECSYPTKEHGCDRHGTHCTVVNCKCDVVGARLKKSTGRRFAEMAITRARAACGVGWSMFSRDLQVRLVHAEILTIVRGWDDSTEITAAKIDAIVDAADEMVP